MWVTQTYLRSPDPKAKVHVYYLFEDYDPKQKSLTDAVQRELALLGQRYGRDVTLYMPEPSSINQIQRELRGIEQLWWNLHNRLPGLLILTTPLEDYCNKNLESFFLPLWVDEGPIAEPKKLAEMIQRLTQITDDHLEWDFSRRQSDDKIPKISKLFDAIEMKPGVWGFRLDLKKFLNSGRH